MANYTLAATAAQVDAAVSAVNDRQIITFYGEFGVTDATTAKGYCCLSVFGNRVDVDLHAKILSNTKSSSVFTLFSTAPLKSALGASGIAWDEKQSEVRIEYNSGSTKVCPSESERGYGGLIARTNSAGDAIVVGRYYSEAVAFGTWGMSSALFDVGNTIHIRVTGATYTM